MCPNSHNVLCNQGGRDPLNTHTRTHTDVKPPPSDLTQCLCQCRTQALIQLSNRPMFLIFQKIHLTFDPNCSRCLAIFHRTLLNLPLILHRHCLHLPLPSHTSLHSVSLFLFLNENMSWVCWKPDCSSSLCGPRMQAFCRIRISSKGGFVAAKLRRWSFLST